MCPITQEEIYSATGEFETEHDWKTEKWVKDKFEDDPETLARILKNAPKFVCSVFGLMIGLPIYKSNSKEKLTRSQSSKQAHATSDEPAAKVAKVGKGGKGGKAKGKGKTLLAITAGTGHLEDDPKPKQKALNKGERKKVEKMLSDIETTTAKLINLKEDAAVPQQAMQQVQLQIAQMCQEQAKLTLMKNDEWKGVATTIFEATTTALEKAEVVATAIGNMLEANAMLAEASVAGPGA